MPKLPNPFEFAGVVMPSADTAVVSPAHAPAPDAAATPFEFGDTDCPPDEAAATLRQSDDAAADICDIAEIFVGARKLNLPPFKLDVDQFMADIEEPPMFLRRASA